MFPNRLFTVASPVASQQQGTQCKSDSGFSVLSLHVPPSIGGDRKWIDGCPYYTTLWGEGQ